MIFADLHDSGGSYVIALSVRNVARQLTPVVPKNFSSWGGSLLNPRLLFALYLCFSTWVSSSVVMRCLCGAVNGVYSSTGISSLWYMALLYRTSWFIGIATSSVPFCFIMFQNFYGCFFRMSGNVNYNRALACLQLFLYSAYAINVSLCFFPCLLLDVLYLRLASLQISSYQGARCLAHLFGLVAMRFFLCCTTPIFNACYIKYSSILADRSSLLCLCASIMFMKVVANSSDDVCCFHALAFSIYYVISLSSTHSIFPSFCPGVSTPRWSVVLPGVLCRGVVAGGGGAVVVEALRSNKYESTNEE